MARHCIEELSMLTGDTNTLRTERMHLGCSDSILFLSSLISTLLILIKHVSITSKALCCTLVFSGNCSMRDKTTSISAGPGMSESLVLLTWVSSEEVKSVLSAVLSDSFWIFFSVRKGTPRSSALFTWLHDVRKQFHMTALMQVILACTLYFPRPPCLQW